MTWVGTILPCQNDSSNGGSRQETVIACIEGGAVRKAADLVIALSAAERRQLLDCILRPYNFFKHADRDPLATLEEDDIDADGVIAHALTALTMISVGSPCSIRSRPISSAVIRWAQRSPDPARPERAMEYRPSAQVSGLGGRCRYKPIFLIR